MGSGKLTERELDARAMVCKALLVIMKLESADRDFHGHCDR